MPQKRKRKTPPKFTKAVELLANTPPISNKDLVKKTKQSNKK